MSTNCTCLHIGAHLKENCLLRMYVFARNTASCALRGGEDGATGRRDGGNAHKHFPSSRKWPSNYLSPSTSSSSSSSFQFSRLLLKNSSPPRFPGLCFPFPLFLRRCRRSKACTTYVRPPAIEETEEEEEEREEEQGVTHWQQPRSAVTNSLKFSSSPHLQSGLSFPLPPHLP